MNRYSSRYDPSAMIRLRQVLHGRVQFDDLSRLDDHLLLQLLAHTPARPRLAPRVELRFDGKFLCWKESSSAVIKKTCWAAVSGRVGYQGKEHVKIEGRGPIPAGRWLVKQGEYQQMPKQNLLEELISEIGRGAWPGGPSSWGRHRVWLKPAAGTETYGRSGFSIHGGDQPGSAGCIDLTGQMPDFVEVFRAHGEDVELTVEYP